MGDIGKKPDLDGFLKTISLFQRGHQAQPIREYLNRNRAIIREIGAVILRGDPEAMTTISPPLVSAGQTKLRFIFIQNVGCPGIPKRRIRGPTSVVTVIERWELLA